MNTRMAKYRKLRNQMAGYSNCTGCIYLRCEDHIRYCDMDVEDDENCSKYDEFAGYEEWLKDEDAKLRFQERQAE